MEDTLSRRLMDALATAWASIRAHHHDVPRVVLLPGVSSRQSSHLGHFGPLRWKARKRSYHEVVIVAERLDRPAAEIFEVLLHEAAHAMNYVRGHRDCSASQYHNKKFKRAAEEIGLIVAQSPNYGFARTSLPPETQRLYREEIENLRRVLVHRRTDDLERPGSRMLKATCLCGFIIRASATTFMSTTILCRACGKPFRRDEA